MTTKQKKKAAKKTKRAKAKKLTLAEARKQLKSMGVEMRRLQIATSDKDGELSDLRGRYSKIHIALHEAEHRHTHRTHEMLLGFACGIGCDVDPDYGCDLQQSVVILPDYDGTHKGSRLIVVAANGNVYHATVTDVK